jgi:hypothetical protein
MGRLLVWDGAKAHPWDMGVDTIEVVMVVEDTTMDHQVPMVVNRLLDHRDMVADTEGRLGVEETGVETAVVAVEEETVAVAVATVVTAVETAAVETAAVAVDMTVDENAIPTRAAVVRIGGMPNDRVIKNQKDNEYSSLKRVVSHFIIFERDKKLPIVAILRINPRH